MTRLRITCINKDERSNPYERITHIGGGRRSNNTDWTLTQQEAINSISLKKYEFFVNVNNREVDVIVAKSKYGNYYLKTTDDNYEPNNLLSLLECPLY